jgi:hypothetical protein
VQQPSEEQWYGTTGVSTSIGKWKHIVISHDKINNVFKYYINGTEVLSGTPYSSISGIANWDKFQLEAYRRGGDINSNSDFDYKYRFVPNAILSPFPAGTGNDLPANFGNYNIYGSSQPIQQWAYDLTDNTVIITEIGFYSGSYTSLMKITLEGADIPSSGRFIPGGTPFTSESALITAYADSSSNTVSLTSTFTKGTGFDDITFDDDTLSWYSSFDLNTTNFWEYMNTYFVATGQFALTGTTIRWEGGANGTDHPDIQINLEDGYVLNINNLWFAADYMKGLQNRKDYSTWWIEDLSPGGLYQFQLYSYNSEGVQQFNASYDVVGSTTQSYTFFMGTTTSPMVTDLIEADANGKIFFNCMDNGVHGSSLAWIRIKAVAPQTPMFEYETTISAGSKSDALPLSTTLSSSTNWMMEIEHEVTSTGTHLICIGNVGTERFYFGGDTGGTTYNQKYRIGLPGSVNIESANTTDIVYGQRNIVRFICNGSNGTYQWIINGVAQPTQSLPSWTDLTITDIYINRHMGSQPGTAMPTNTMYAFRYWDF